YFTRRRAMCPKIMGSHSTTSVSVIFECEWFHHTPLRRCLVTFGQSPIVSSLRITSSSCARLRASQATTRRSLFSTLNGAHFCTIWKNPPRTHSFHAVI